MKDPAKSDKDQLVQKASDLLDEWDRMKDAGELKLEIGVHPQISNQYRRLNEAVAELRHVLGKL